jgi:hypothetical protein
VSRRRPLSSELARLLAEHGLPILAPEPQ